MKTAVAIPDWIKVGNEVVLYYGKYSEPIKTKIVRVTPGGKCEVAADENSLFSKSPFGNYYYIKHAKWVRVHPITEYTRLQKVWGDDQAEIKASREEREKQHAEEMLVAKTACNDAVNDSKPEILADGTRLYILRLPVHPKLTYQRGFEVLIVRCWTEDDKTLSFSRGDIGMAYTYISGRTQSFPSCSTSYHKTDMEAVWEAVCYAYNNVY